MLYKLQVSKKADCGYQMYGSIGTVRVKVSVHKGKG